MKKYFLLFAILLTSCNILPQYTPAPVMAAGWTPIPTDQPTSTPVPSPTIGYMDTAVVAQQTAMEAVRVNAVITAEFEQRVQEQLNLTAESDRRYFEMQGWTQTAAPTSIALTQTAQVIVIGQMTLQAGQMTATAQAPTLIVAMADAQSKAKHAETDYIINMIGIGAIAFLCIVVAWFLIWKMRTVTTADIMHERQQEDQAESARDNYDQNKPLGTIVTMKKETNLQRTVIPCSPEQLTELAENLTQGKKTLAINQWEGKGTKFTRPVILQVRNWARENNFAAPTDDGQLAPTNEFLTFLIGWLATKELREGFDFGRQTPTPPEPEPSMS